MRKLALFSIPFALAAALYVYLLSPSWGLIAAGVCVLFILALLLLAGKWKRKAIAVLIGAAVSLLWCSAYELFYLQPAWAQADQRQTLTLTVTDYPTQNRYGYWTSTVGTVAGRPVRIGLTHYENCPDLKPGDQIVITAKLKKSLRKYGDETFLYQIAKGTVLTASVSHPDQILPCERIPVWAWPKTASHFVGERLEAIFPSDVSAYLRALTTGDKSHIDDVTLQTLSVAGVSHTVAVSGMHISILLTAILFLLPGSRPLRAGIGTVVVILFALFTGGSPSVVRAAIMQIYVLFAPVFNRESDAPTVFGGAMLVILLPNPWAVADVSFQLSFGALVGLLWLTPQIQTRMKEISWIKKSMDKPAISKIILFFMTCVSATVGASFLTVPIVALTFGTVSIYALLTNLLILWAIPFCMIGSFLTVLLSLVWPFGAHLLSFPLTLLVRYILGTAGLVARLPFASLSANSPYVVFWLIFVYLICGVSYLFKEFKPFPITVCCTVAALIGVLVFSVQQHAGKQFEISALDVGQGQCLVLQTKERTYMIDCGGSTPGAAGETAVRFLQSTGTFSLDGLVLTHYDLDHSGGVPYLLSTLPVGTVFLPDTEEGNENRIAIERLAEEKGISLVFVTDVFLDPFPDGTLQIFPPVSNFDKNAACLSVLYSVGDYDLLVTGDMDRFSEHDLLLKYDLPCVELYVAGHHGAKDSSGEELLSAIRPLAVLISVGNNSYGHPNEETLARFKAIGAKIYRTDECGTITIGG